jgi:hypothetical protein
MSPRKWHKGYLLCALQYLESRSAVFGMGADVGFIKSATIPPVTSPLVAQFRLRSRTKKRRGVVTRILRARKKRTCMPPIIQSPAPMTDGYIRYVVETILGHEFKKNVRPVQQIRKVNERSAS